MGIPVVFLWTHSILLKLYSVLVGSYVCCMFMLLLMSYQYYLINEETVVGGGEEGIIS